jgi:single-strand DNA-binding protein
MSIKSLNKVCLIGNIGQDPKTGTTKNDKPWASFSLATSEGYKGKDGEWVEQTEWHNIKTFNERVCKVIADFVRKGSKVYLEGQLKSKKYTDENGIEKFATDIVIPIFGGEFVLLDKKEPKPATPQAADEQLVDEIPW